MGEPEVVVLAVGQPPGQGVVLSHELACAGGGLAVPDQGGGAVGAELGGQGSRVRGAAVAGRLAHQCLHRGDRVGGLGGPAPLAGGCAVGDGLQFPQGVRAAQLVISAGVAIVGRPGVVHGDPGEPGQDAHRLHGLPAAPGMHHEQGVLAGAGAVHPGKPAVHAEPGLVEPGHAGVGDLLAGMLQEPAQAPGGVGSEAGHGAR
jgi:hypothetical protein